jgi:hypothetical protein
MQSHSFFLFSNFHFQFPGLHQEKCISCFNQIFPHELKFWCVISHLQINDAQNSINDVLLENNLLNNVNMENYGQILTVADQLNIRIFEEAATDFVKVIGTTET